MFLYKKVFIFIFCAFIMANGFAQTLISPSDNSYIRDSIVNFSWNNRNNVNVKFQISKNSDFSTLVKDTVITGSNICKLGLNYCNTYYWKVGFQKADLSYEWTAFKKIIVFNANCVSGAEVWLSADTGIVKDGSNNISKWKNLASLDSAKQSNISYQPKFIANDFNNKASVRFDGANDFLSIIKSINIGTVFLLGDYNSATTFPGYKAFLSSGNYNYLIYGNPVTTNIEYLYFNSTTLMMNDVVTKNYNPLQKKKVLVLKANPLSITDLYFAASHSGTASFWNGNINEAIIYNKKLSDAEISQINNFIYDKYSSPVNLGADIEVLYGFCDTTLKAGEGYESYLWNTGETTSSIKVHKSGTYSVKVKNLFGKETTDEINVYFPSAKINIKDTTICKGDTIQIGVNINGNYNYTWNTSQTTKQINVSTEGTYYTTISDTLGCISKSDTMQLHIDNFGEQVSLGSDTTFCKGNKIQIQTPSSNYSQYTIKWNDNSSDSLLTINTTGNYSVEITNNRGCKGKDTIQVTINGEAPNVQFAIPSISCYGDTLHFINNTTTSPSDTVVTWQWTMGDGQTLTNKEIYYKYNTAGTYNVKLNAVSQSGCANQYNKNIQINNLPEAKFLYSNSCENKAVNLTDISIFNDNDTIQHWQWNFGDTQTSNIQNPTHTYTAEGNYAVRLEVTTKNNCKSSKKEAIQIYNSTTIPVKIVLENPSNDKIIYDNQYTFEWNSENAIRYDLHICTDSFFVDNVRKIENLTTEQATVNNLFITNKVIYWKVKGYNLCDSSKYSSINKLRYFSPQEVSGLSIWYASDSLGTENDSIVNHLYDKSGNGYDAEQNTISNKPKIQHYKKDLPYSYINFDGTNDYLQITDSMELGTVFMLLDYSTGTYFPGYKCLISNNTEQYNVYGNSGSTNLNANYLSNNKIFINSVQTNNFSPFGKPKLLTFTFNKKKFKNLYLMSNLGSNSYWNGRLWEILAFDTILSQESIDKVENYIYNKYVSPVNLGSDIEVLYGFCDTTLKAGEGYESYLWNTGETTSSIKVHKSGTYSVKVKNLFGKETIDEINVYFPNTKLNIKDTTICKGDTIQIGVNINGNYNYSWNTSQTTKQIKISSEGIYYTTVSDTMGCTFKSDTMQLHLDNFGEQVSLGNDTTFCKGNKIQIQNPSSNYSQYTIKWNDNSSDSLLTINTTGNYSVEITNNRGCKGKDTIQVTINGEAPNVQFAIPSISCYGDTLHFINNTITNPSDTVVSWQWTMGDGQTLTNKEIYYKYNTAGIYNVKLNAVSQSGCANLFNKNIQINNLPEAKFLLTNSCENKSINFNDISISKDNDTIQHWQWNFGDTQISNVQNPIHTYTTEGNYAVILEVRTKNNCKSNKTEAIQIYNSNTIPVKIVLENPINDKIIYDNQNTFEWNSENAIRYDLHICTDSFFVDNVRKIENLTTEQATVNNLFITNKVIYWKVKGYNLCDSSKYSSINKLRYFSPQEVSGLSIWFATDTLGIENDSIVNHLYDKSGNGYNAEQNTMSNKPKIQHYKKDLPYSYINFDGTNDYLQITDSMELGTIFMLLDYSTGTYFPGYKCLISNNTEQYNVYGNSGSTIINTNNLTNFKTYINSVQTNNFSPFGNPKLLTLTFNKKKFKNLYLMSNLGSNSYWNGRLWEMLAFDTILSNQNIQIIENYIYDKYSSSVYLGADKSVKYGFCADTINAGNNYVKYLWNTGDTTSKIGVTKSGKYFVTVLDIFGRQSSDTINIVFPYNKYQRDTLICYGEIANYKAELNGKYFYNWNEEGFIEDNFYNIDSEGVYTLKIQDTLNCFVTDTFYVEVDSFPIVATLGSDRSFCKGEFLGLQNSGNEVAFYQWSNNSFDPTIEITQAGTYSLTALNFNNCTLKDTINISIRGVMPQTIFSADTVCYGSETHFSDLSSVEQPSLLKEWKWRFGDGDTSVHQHPIHLFDNYGNYNVELTVTTDSGCVKSYNKQVQVQSMPKANFTPLLGCSGVPLRFNNKSSNEVGDIVKYAWNFGDLSIPDSNYAYTSNPSHTYYTTANYKVNLIAETSKSCKDTIEYDVVIRPSANVAFEFTNPCLGQTTYFVDKTTTQAGNLIIGRWWDFGDGASSSFANPEHLYANTNKYPVSMKVKTINGCERKITDTVKINPLPSVAFNYNDVCSGDLFEFTNNTSINSGFIAKNNWYLNYKQTSTAEDFINSINTAGKYKLTLVSESNNKCIDSLTNEFEVFPVPQSDFSIVSNSSAAPADVQLINNTSNAFSYFWDLGDGSTSTNHDIANHFYSNNGVYKIKLISMNGHGCYDTIEKTLQLTSQMTDLAILSVNKKVVGNYLQAIIEVINMGSYTIQQFDVDFNIDNNNSIREKWNGVLQPGQTIIYNTNALLKYNAADDNLMCVQVNMSNISDITPDNNKLCYALKETFDILDIYPNPANEKVFFTVILPFADNVKIEIFDVLGNKINGNTDVAFEKGYNRLPFDISFLRKGMYSVRFIWNDNTIVKKFNIY